MKLTLRDLFWLTLVVALLVGGGLMLRDRNGLARRNEELAVESQKLKVQLESYDVVISASPARKLPSILFTPPPESARVRYLLDEPQTSPVMDFETRRGRTFEPSR